MGPIHVRFAILMHEAAHKLLFSKKRLNDFVGTWLIAYPAFVPITLYRRGHLSHHRDEFGPDEPDMGFYQGYPCEPSDLRRRLLRDALGISGWKNFWALLRARKKHCRPNSSYSVGTLGGVLDRNWRVVDLPLVVVASVDDTVESAEPAPCDR